MRVDYECSPGARSGELDRVWIGVLEDSDSEIPDPDWTTSVVVELDGLRDCTPTTIFPFVNHDYHLFKLVSNRIHNQLHCR